MISLNGAESIDRRSSSKEEPLSAAYGSRNWKHFCAIFEDCSTREQRKLESSLPQSFRSPPSASPHLLAIFTVAGSRQTAASLIRCYIKPATPDCCSRLKLRSSYFEIGGISSGKRRRSTNRSWNWNKSTKSGRWTSKRLYQQVNNVSFDKDPASMTYKQTQPVRVTLVGKKA